VRRALVDAVKAVLSEKQTLEQRERELVAQLDGALRALGYRVVPRSPAAGSPAPASPRPASRRTRRSRPGPARGPKGEGSKPLECPHCDRRFAQPVNLGRHVSATHGKARQRKTA